MRTGMDGGSRDSGISLAELLAAFSFAMDLGLGQPMEHVLRSWQLAHAWVSASGWWPSSGPICTTRRCWRGWVASPTRQVSAWFGDDIAFRADSYRVDLRGLGGATFCSRAPVRLVPC